MERGELWVSPGGSAKGIAGAIGHEEPSSCPCCSFICLCHQPKGGTGGRMLGWNGPSSCGGDTVPLSPLPGEVQEHSSGDRGTASPAPCPVLQIPTSALPTAPPCPSLPLPAPPHLTGLGSPCWPLPDFGAVPALGCRVSGRDSPVPFCSTAQQTRLLKPIPSAECWALLTVQHCPKLPGLKGFNPKQSLPNSFCSRSSISWARATHRVTGITSPCSQH